MSEPTVLKKVFFNVDNPRWVNFIANMFYINPCFQFGKIFADINNIVTAHFDVMSLNWVQSNEIFEYHHMFEGQSGEFFSKDRYYVVPMTDTLWTFLYNMMIFGTLAWYLDNTLSQNRGVPKPWYFPLMVSYWFPFLDN